MNVQAEGKYKAAGERLRSAPDDLETLKSFAEAARGFDRRDEALAALKAAYQRRPTPELYTELRSICTYPEFQAIAPPASLATAPQKQSGTGAEILPRKAFPLLLDQVIFYPVQDGLSVFILVCCGLALALGDLLIGYAGILGLSAAVVFWGVAFGYFWSVLHASGMGEKHTRGWPDLADPSQLGTAVGMYIVVSLFCFLPSLAPILIPLINGDELTLAHFGGAILLGLLGVAYYPMALMIAGFTQDATQLFNVAAGARSIAKIAGDYLICLGFFIATYIALIAIRIGLNVVKSSGNVPMIIVLTLFASVVYGYFVIVQMRAAGLLYYSREKDLGWFQ
jgi:hypothetical protein